MLGNPPSAAFSTVDPCGEAGIPLFIRKRPCDLLTVIITTSVIPAHPSTRLMSEVLSSYVRHEPQLSLCPKIIVCDFPKLSVTNLRHYKSGKILSSDFDRYESYIQSLESFALQKSFPYCNTRIHRCTRYRGFACAVQEALDLVTTQFVIIIQHDRVLMKPFGLEHVLTLMQTQPTVLKYVGLASDTSMGQVHQVHSRYRMDLTSKMQIMDPCENPALLSRQLIANNNLLPPPPARCRILVPLIFWYDSTHLARVDHYRNFVFSHSPATSFSLWTKLKTGDFIEDKLGQVQREDIKANGLEAHDKYGTYLLEDNHGPYVRHCHGRMINTSSKRTFEIYFGGDEEEASS